MLTLKQIKEQKVTLPASFVVGILAMVWGTYLDFFRGSPSLNTYTLLGILFLVHFIHTLEQQSKLIALWGLWFSGLLTQIVYLFVRDSFTMVWPFGLMVAYFLLANRQTGGRFNRMACMIMLGVLPFEFGSVIGIIAMTYAGLSQKEDRLDAGMYALALTIAAVIATGGWSILALIGALVMGAYKPTEGEQDVSFLSYSVSIILGYSMYLVVAGVLLMY